MTTDYISEVFGAGGLFASKYPGYEMREGQMALARLVDTAMRTGTHALGEGPCGTGKGNAYSVPAVWHSYFRRKKVLLATANIALQEQLVNKDLPRLAEVLPWPFRFALLKGRRNFLCRSRAAMTERQLAEAPPGSDPLGRELREVARWARKTLRGNVSELPFVPDPGVWERFSVSAEDCVPERCPYRARCCAEQAKAEAAAADIVVSNFHLLFAHLSVRAKTGKNLVLPKFDLLVMDEAHEAPHIARDFLGFAVSESAAVKLARFAERHGEAPLAEALRESASTFFEEVAAYCCEAR